MTVVDDAHRAEEVAAASWERYAASSLGEILPRVHRLLDC